MQSIGKFAKPGDSVYNEAELWRDVCKDLEVPNTLANRLKICKATAHLWKVFSVTLKNHKINSSQVELCHSATCGDIQWNEMSCLTGPRCYINTDIKQ